MNPNFQSESLNMTMERYQQYAQFYGQGQGQEMVAGNGWQQYMQNSMAQRHSPAAAYYNPGLNFPHEPPQQMPSQANFDLMGSTERPLSQERLGSVTPGERTSPASIRSYGEKQAIPSNQFSNEMLHFVPTQQDRVNFSPLNQEHGRGITSPPKECSPSVSASYVQSHEIQPNQYSNEASPYMDSRANNTSGDYGSMNLSRGKVPASSPHARNSPLVTAGYEVKQETLQSQYENDMMNYMTQIRKISNPSYTGTNSNQDLVSGSPPVSKNSPAFMSSYNVKQEPHQNQHPNEMMNYPSAQQKDDALRFNPASDQKPALSSLEQRDSPIPSTSPYVTKPEVTSALHANQHTNQMLQYMAEHAREGKLNYGDRSLSEGGLPAAMSSRGSMENSAQLGSFEVKQELPPQTMCSKDSLEYRYSQSHENQAQFDGPKPETKGSPFNESQDSACSTDSYPVANPQMQSSVNPYQFGGFNPYMGKQIAGRPNMPPFPGGVPVDYYNQASFAGSHMQGQGQMESKHRMMFPQQQFYGVNSYPANYPVNLNTQRYFQQGMMGNQWQAMPENYGHVMGYGKRKNMDNGINGIAMTSKKSRGYNDEDYDFELCNSWEEVIEVTDYKTESGEEENGKNSEEPEKRPVRTIFTYNFDNSLTEVSHNVILAEQRLCLELKKICFRKPILHIYNPLVYAFETHLDFVRRFCSTKKTVLFLGMNPGPFGMSQNGIPFGEVGIVRDWFNVKGQINKPSREHHKRQITGFQCQRSEVSGSRFWGLFKSICGTPENFFRHCFVYNICPMAFISPTSKNITPAQLPVRERTLLYNACNAALLDILRTLDVKIVVAVGKFAEGQAMMVANDAKLTDLTIQSILHPSPINPAANRGWESAVLQQLRDMDVMKYFGV